MNYFSGHPDFELAIKALVEVVGNGRVLSELAKEMHALRPSLKGRKRAEINQAQAWLQGNFWGLNVIAEAENRRLVVTSDGHRGEPAMVYKYGTPVEHISLLDMVDHGVRNTPETFAHLVGVSVGKLTVKSFYRDNTSGKSLIWSKCQCDCGAVISRRVYDIQRHLKNADNAACAKCASKRIGKHGKRGDKWLRLYKGRPLSYYSKFS